jgi:hypothetical protein
MLITRAGDGNHSRVESNFRLPTGLLPAEIAGRIYRSLADHADKTKLGRAFTDNLGYAIALLPSERESFSPAAFFHRGPFPQNRLRFINGAPHFAVQVRSENDDKPSAELKIADKRADYFQAGTEVVWDVDTWPSVFTFIALPILLIP